MKHFKLDSETKTKMKISLQPISKQLNKKLIMVQQNAIVNIYNYLKTNYNLICN